MLEKVTDPLDYDRPHAESWVDFMNDLHLNVKEASYGALGNDTGNDAPAIQAAINDVPVTGGVVYLPRGTYRVTSSIVFPTDRQVRLIGAGRGQTHLHVVAGTTATPGIIHIRGTELRSSVEHLEITFDQPDTAIRGNLTAYVPAIYAQGIARFRVQHVKITRAWDGIDMRTNSNCEINDLEISHFNTGIYIDGSLDSIRISHGHFWPFGCTPNQVTCMADESNVGIRAGRTDGTHITDCLFHCGTGIFTFASVTTTGKPVLYITNCSFDTYSGILQTAGILMVSNCAFGTYTASGYQAIRAAVGIETGSLAVSNCVFTTNGGTGAPVELLGASGGNALFVGFTSCQFFTGSGDQSSIRMDATAGGILHCSVESSHFSRTANTAYTAATLYAGTNVRSIIANNITTDKGTGAGAFVQIATDNYHTVVDNIFLGWALSLPAAHSTLSVYGNTGASGSSQVARGGEQQMGARVYRTTTQSIPHNTMTAITFDAERNDASGWHSPGSAQIIVPVSGWFIGGASVEWATGSSGERYCVLIRNGTIQIAVSALTVSSTDLALQTVSTGYYFSAGDTVELFVLQTSGSPVNVVATPQRSPELWLARCAP